MESTKVLADIVHEYGQSRRPAWSPHNMLIPLLLTGQRAFVGVSLTYCTMRQQLTAVYQKCNMNRNCPDYYVEPSSEASLSATKDLIAHIRSFPRPARGNSTLDALVQPILTPRFAISCTPDLMSSLGELASSDSTLRIQTHISENPREVAYTKELFPNSKTYTNVYDDHGLLRENTILAHAIHLEDEEVELIKRRKAGISHCPTSNFNLSSGVARVGEYLDRGIKVNISPWPTSFLAHYPHSPQVGLGTDVSGGFSPSILTVIQHTSIASKVISFTSKPTPSKPDSFANKHLPIATLLFLATLGGAQVCCLEHQVGSFAVGKSFDALIVNVTNGAGNPALWSSLGEGEGGATVGKEALEGMLERFLFCGDDRNISSVYVQGRHIGGKNFGV